MFRFRNQVVDFVLRLATARWRALTARGRCKLFVRFLQSGAGMGCGNRLCASVRRVGSGTLIPQLILISRGMLVLWRLYSWQ